MNRKRKYLPWLVVLLAAIACVALLKPSLPLSLLQRVKGRKSIAQRLQDFGPVARERLQPHFERAGVRYPPAAVTVVGFKEERRLEVYAGNEGGMRFIRSWPILAASGRAGPKLVEGDQQVPEGVYPIESLNPNSLFHVALRVGYPNRFDREMARQDGRHQLGGDIMIHGSSVSVGCLAMGDEVAEELFVLAADTGLSNLTVVLCPADFRDGRSRSLPVESPAWTPSLYAELHRALAGLPRAN
jgi:hypothetical protein